MGDDDTIIIRRKIARAAALLVKPLPSVKVWHLALVLAAGFGLGAWLV